MSGRPSGAGPPPTLRVEILKELQQLIDERDFRDRLDRSPIAETKGREHWVLHLLLRADELGQSHLDQLVGSAYSNLITRLEGITDQLERLENRVGSAASDTRTRLEKLDTAVGQQIRLGFEEGSSQLAERLAQALNQNLDQKWKPIGDSIETFSEGSRQMLRDVEDTYRLVTQTRLLLNENARRIIDLGRDIVALEESQKLVLSKTIEESLTPLEQRVSALENQLGMASPSTSGAARTSPEKPPATADE